MHFCESIIILFVVRKDKCRIKYSRGINCYNNKNSTTFLDSLSRDTSYILHYTVVLSFTVLCLNQPGFDPGAPNFEADFLIIRATEVVRCRKD